LKRKNFFENKIYFSYIVIWKKGYQQFQEPRGTSVIKVKGIAKVLGNNTFFDISKFRSSGFCFLY